MIDVVQIYKEAIQNEMCMAETMGVNAFEYYAKFAGIKNKKLISILSSVITPVQILIVIFSHLTVLVNLIISLLKWEGGKKNDKEIKGCKLFLLFTPLFSERLSKTDINQTENVVWFIGPNMKTISIPRNSVVIKWKDYISRRDLLDAFISVHKIFYHYLCYTRVLNPVYRYWNFCLVAKGLEIMSQGNDLYFSNQSDRWALLFDKLPARKKTLLQHGIDLDYSGRLVRLKGIDSFYAISKGSWQNSYAYLLDCKPELHIMKPTIELTEIDDSGLFTILIISHIIYIDIEKEILEAIKGMPVKIFLKKHPAINNDDVYKELQEKYGFVYITDKKFPKVNFVISYESTLVYEYMNYDIPLYVYYLEKGVDTSRLKYEINSLIKEK